VNKNLIKECLIFSRDHLARNGRHNHFIHYSFIIQFNQVIEWGINKKTEPLKKFGYADHMMLHSENTAYKKAKGLLDKTEPFEVLNIRLNSNGDLKISKPCQCCVSFLKHLGCSKVWYSTPTDFLRVIL